MTTPAEVLDLATYFQMRAAMKQEPAATNYRKAAKFLGEYAQKLEESDARIEFRPTVPESSDLGSGDSTQSVDPVGDTVPGERVGSADPEGLPVGEAGGDPEKDS